MSVASDRRKWPRFDSPDWSFVIAALLVSLFLFCLLRPAWKPGNFISATGPGADGLFNYRLALNPFTHQPLDHGIQLDRPAARQQRILYPLVVWLAAFGNALFVPALLVFVNYLALCLLGWLGGAYFQTHGRHALWGLLVPLYPGGLIALRCDSVEPLMLCLLLASLLALRRARAGWATLLLALALLTKETALLAVLAAAFVYASARRRGDAPPVKWYYFGVPLLIFIIWQAVLFFIWGTLPILNDGRDIGLPLVGFVRLLFGVTQMQTPATARVLVASIFLFGFGVLAAFQWRRASALSYERAAWALYAGWAFALNARVWNGDWNFMRALTEVYLFGAIIIIVSGAKVPVKLALGAGIIALWCWQAYSLMHGLS